MPSTAPAATTTPRAATFRDVRPPFFRVAGRGGAELRVMGTIHLGPAAGWRPSAEIDRAIREADRFAFELDLRAIDEGAVGDQLAAMVLLPPGRTITDVVTPATAEVLEANDALLARYGMPRNARVRFKPWYVAVSLVQATAEDAGYDMSQSAEDMLLARLGGRPVFGLETFDAQLRMLDSLEAEAQDAMLRDTVARLPEAAAELDTLVRAWRQPDREELVRLSRLGVDEIPALEAFFDRLLVERNRSWFARLRPLLEDPTLAGRSVFVGVGALHTVGPDGLETLFRDAGYEVERIH